MALLTRATSATYLRSRCAAPAGSGGGGTRALRAPAAADASAGLTAQHPLHCFSSQPASGASAWLTVLGQLEVCLHVHSMLASPLPPAWLVPGPWLLAARCSPVLATCLLQPRPHQTASSCCCWPASQQQETQEHLHTHTHTRMQAGSHTGSNISGGHA